MVICADWKCMQGDYLYQKLLTDVWCLICTKIIRYLTAGDHRSFLNYRQTAVHNGMTTAYLMAAILRRFYLHHLTWSISCWLTRFKPLLKSKLGSELKESWNEKQQIKIQHPTLLSIKLSNMWVWRKLKTPNTNSWVHLHVHFNA